MKKTLFTLFFLKSLLLSACLSPGAQPATGSDAAVRGGSTTTAPAGSAGSAVGGGEEPAPGGESATSGAVARADGGGIVGAPSSREGIQTIGRNIRVVSLPASVHDRCRDFECVKRMVHAGDDLLVPAKIVHGDLKIDYEGAAGSFGIGVYEEGREWPGYPPADVPAAFSVTDVGFHLFFVRKKDVAEMLGDPTATAATIEELLVFLDDARVDYVGDRFIPPPASGGSPFIRLPPGSLPPILYRPSSP